MHRDLLSKSMAEKDRPSQIFPFKKHGVLNLEWPFNSSWRLNDLIKFMWLVQQDTGILIE